MARACAACRNCNRLGIICPTRPTLSACVALLVVLRPPQHLNAQPELQAECSMHDKESHDACAKEGVLFDGSKGKQENPKVRDAEHNMNASNSTVQEVQCRHHEHEKFSV